MTTEYRVLTSEEMNIDIDSKMEMVADVHPYTCGGEFVNLTQGAPEALAVAVRLIYAVWLYEPDLVARCLCDLGIDVINTFNGLEGDRYVAN